MQRIDMKTVKGIKTKTNGYKPPELAEVIEV